jgi:hypothetical protein
MPKVAKLSKSGYSKNHLRNFTILGTPYCHFWSGFYINVVKKMFVTVTGALITLDCSYFGNAQGSQVK